MPGRWSVDSRAAGHGPGRPAKRRSAMECDHFLGPSTMAYSRAAASYRRGPSIQGRERAGSGPWMLGRVFVVIHVVHVIASWLSLAAFAFVRPVLTQGLACSLGYGTGRRIRSQCGHGGLRGRMRREAWSGRCKLGCLSAHAGHLSG